MKETERKGKRVKGRDSGKEGRGKERRVVKVKEGKTVDRWRQWSGEKEGKRRRLLRERKGIRRLKGGDSGKEGRGKEKKVIKEKGRGDS